MRGERERENEVDIPYIFVTLAEWPWTKLQHTIPPYYYFVSSVL